MDGLNSKRATILYFSGTGGTRRVAEALRRAFAKQHCDCTVLELDAKDQETKDSEIDEQVTHSQYFLFVFPVYAVDAPRPVYQWIHRSTLRHPYTVVLSVSGGGEVWPNIGVRRPVIRALERRGFSVRYDRMLVMPSNWTVSGGDHLNMHLLRALPSKSTAIVDELIKFQPRRDYRRRAPFMAVMSKMESFGAGYIGRNYKVSQDCNGCGWCARSYPVGNIRMDQGTRRPRFSTECVLCFRCLYGCPRTALSTQYAKFMVLKEGFDLRALERRMEGVELQSIKECCKGWLWRGVAAYLRQES